MASKHEQMAAVIFFHGGKVDDILAQHGMVLLEGKTPQDFIAAFRQGMEEGRGTFEREMMCAGKALKSVCKEQA